MLQGRIEQLFNQDGASLPGRASRQQSGIVERKSFPRFLRGEFKGKLKVVKVDLNPLYFEQSPVDARTDNGFFTIGRKGNSRFRFYSSDNSKLLLDPEVRFPYNREEKNRLSRGGGIMLNLGQALNAGQYSTNGRQCWVRETILKDNVRMLSDTSVEQVLVTLNIATHKRTGRQRTFYSEHVSQFEKAGRFKLDVSIAEVEYGPDGRWWKKLLLKGTVH